MSGRAKDIDSPLVNVASEIEERRCDLIGRHRHLRDKVATLERSIPALMAYNMWMADSTDCRDAPYSKVREIVNELSPQPDPADRLLVELRGTVDGLHQETAQLHDKIIDADVKLEETAMELESLELANRETEEKLMGLRDEVQRRKTPSLHSIHSEDLICLKKIRQLAEEEFKLKSCIEELRGKETAYRRHMKRLLSCKRFQRNIGGTAAQRGVQESRGRSGDRPLESADKRKGQKTCCACLTSMLTAREKTSRRSFHVCPSSEKFRPPFSCCVPLDGRPRAITGHKPQGGCRASCKPCQTTLAVPVSESSRPKSPPCEVPRDVTSKTGVSRPVKRPAQPSAPCEPGKTCNECETADACKQIDSCLCTCEGKCTRVLSTAPCDCTARPAGEGPRADDSDSDEEFCECCSCGCENSENSS